MTIQTQLIDYDCNGKPYEGLLVWDDAAPGPVPGVLVAHTIAGRTAHEEKRAAMLAELGYVGIAMDVYGKGTQTTDPDQNLAMMTALRNDRPELQARLQAGLKTLREQRQVDATKVAAIGFCFGGLSVLDLARTVDDIAGVASFHGIFDAPGNTQGRKIRARVLALHGWEDPLATPQNVAELAEEMTAMGADWQLHAYGNTTHAFTNPKADDWEGGKQYDANADRRSWQAMTNFLAELFGD